MPSRALRFVHSADWHLERMPSGFTEIPDHLRDLLADAPYRAAALVIDTALNEQVDFVVLAGGILKPREAGARGLLFVQDQLQRLHDRNIPVYWAGGDVDRVEELGEYLALPENVRIFPAGRVGECVHKRDGQPIARVLGASRELRTHVNPLDFPNDDQGLLTIGVLSSAQAGDNYSRSGIHYWALGGRHDGCGRENAATSQFSGTPVGRSPNEPGRHGCNLVNVDEAGYVHSKQVNTDALRYHNEIVEVSTTLSGEEFQRRLRERMESLISDSSRCAHFVSWHVTGQGPVIRALQNGTLLNETLRQLRDQYGRRDPIGWTLEIDIEPSVQFAPALFEQDSILGSFLRSWQRQQESGVASMEWRKFLPENPAEGSALTRLALTEPRDIGLIGRQAAALGVDLLSGEETRT